MDEQATKTGSVIITVTNFCSELPGGQPSLTVLVNSPVTITYDAEKPSALDHQRGWFEQVLHGTEKTGLQITIFITTIAALAGFVWYKINPSPHSLVEPTWSTSEAAHKRSIPLVRTPPAKNREPTPAGDN